jgi:hypothetical protein
METRNRRVTILGWMLLALLSYGAVSCVQSKRSQPAMDAPDGGFTDGGSPDAGDDGPRTNNGSMEVVPGGTRPP